ncbi:MAG: RIP metalloprotease RseP [Gammaproteobacteria bacterium]|nr:RIP metalloprotease RseP [Gammaproteobacteria bacterium]
MNDFLLSIVAFVVAISILVAVHEWGHYIVARLAGVKVLRFSIGFGRPLWIRRFGPDKTEFCVAAIPVGGYVKLLDERDCAVALADQSRAFNRQSARTKIAVLVAGPLLNFIFAVLAYWLIYTMGVPGVKPVVGEIEPESIAARAGLIEGDQILAVAGQGVATWDGAILGLVESLLDEGDIPLTVAGLDGEPRDIELQASGRESELTEPGRLFIGLGFRPWSPVLPAVIDEVVPEGSAQRAGLKGGDLIVEADGQAIESWSQWVEFIRAHPDERISVAALRGNEQVLLDLDIDRIDESGESIGRIGASVRVPDNLMEGMEAEQRYGVAAAANAALDKTWNMTTLTLKMMGSMLTGSVSAKNISGPINIAQYAGQSAGIGLVSFLSFLAIVSISLGILNLLPIPMLDGGQILYQAIESLKGSPMSERAQMLGQQVGVVLLLMLMSFAFYNDLMRIFS